jgi:hypothetical protein
VAVVIPGRPRPSNSGLPSSRWCVTDSVVLAAGSWQLAAAAGRRRPRQPPAGRPRPPTAEAGGLRYWDLGLGPGAGAWGLAPGRKKNLAEKNKPWKWRLYLYPPGTLEYSLCPVVVQGVTIFLPWIRY